WGALGLVVVLALLTFVPSRYLYPTQRGRLNQVTNLLSVPWAALLLWVLWRLPDDDPEFGLARQLAMLSLFFPIYYITASWLITLRLWRRARRARKEVRTALS